MGRGRWIRNFVGAMRRPRWRWALSFAAASDAVSFGLEFFGLGLAELPQVLVDLASALVLAGLLGPRLGLVWPLIAEAFPATAAFPSWALAVAALAAMEAEPGSGAGGQGPGDGAQ